MVSALKPGRRSLRVLDAGCGERCALPYAPDARVTGVDVSAELLERNERLDERIVADLAQASLPDDSFDVIVCWDVLEHLRDPPRALASLSRALAPGGLLILKAPNLRSPKGLVTKYTPFRFHRWVYRRFEVAPGTDPFPTRFRRSVAPGAIETWARDRDLSLCYSAYWESDLQRRLRARLRLQGRAWAATRGMVRSLSLGALDAQGTEFVLVFARR